MVACLNKTFLNLYIFSSLKIFKDCLQWANIFNVFNSLFRLDLYALVRQINFLKPVWDRMYGDIFVALKKWVKLKAFWTSSNLTCLVDVKEDFLSLSHLINQFPCLIFISNQFWNRLGIYLFIFFRVGCWCSALFDTLSCL